METLVCHPLQCSQWMLSAIVLGTVVQLYPLFQSILTAQSILEEVVNSSEEASQILQGLGFPDCRTCPVRLDETLVEAAENYEVDLMDLLGRLNLAMLSEAVRRMASVPSVSKSELWMSRVRDSQPDYDNHSEGIEQSRTL